MVDGHRTRWYLREMKRSGSPVSAVTMNDRVVFFGGFTSVNMKNSYLPEKRMAKRHDGG